MPGIVGTTAFITGGNRGLGRAIGLTLLGQGAAKVYAGARDPRSVTDPGLTPVRLDVTDDATVRTAADLAADVDLLSVASWFPTPNGSGYAATKAALWSLTNAWRRELRDQGTHVLGVHVGPLDTEPQKDYQGEKLDPFELARQILNALEHDEVELLADERTRDVKALLGGSPAALG